MNVFFTASLRGMKYFDTNFKQIYEELKKLRFTHLDDEIFDLDSEKFYAQIEKSGQRGYSDWYQLKIKSLKEADICVFECSIPSLGVGFLIQKALDFNKPVVVLYSGENIPHFLVGINEEKLFMRKYTKETLIKILHETVDEAKEHRDKRFNFFISPKLLNYIEKASHEKGITKSLLIRSLIIDHMKRNSWL